jgi:hypothetical protein
MSFLTRFTSEVAASGLVAAIRALERKVPAMSTAAVEDKLTENTQALARQMAQCAQRGEKVPDEIIAAALAAGYCAAELRNRERPGRT